MVAYGDTGHLYSIATRAQRVALRDAGWTDNQIHASSGVSVRQIQYYYNNALKRGYNPAESKLLEENISLTLHALEYESPSITKLSIFARNPRSSRQ